MNTTIIIKKNLSNFITIVLSLSLFVTFSFADSGGNGSCSSAEIIGELNNKSTSTMHTETGAVLNNGNDYYKFTLNENGLLHINITAANDYTFFVSDNLCDTWNEYVGSTPQETHIKNNISVTSGHTYYLRIHANVHRSDYSLNIDYEAKPPITLSIDDVILNEGNYGIYTKKIPVKLSYKGEDTVSVDYTTSNGSANNGSDYNATSGTLVFSGTDTTKTIEVNINGDSIQETNEIFNITLLNSIGASISDSSAQITLVNDDGGTAQLGDRDFIIRNPSNTRNIKGNIKVIGNTVLCYKGGGSTCIDTDSANNRIYLSFIDTNSTNHTYNNSSTATITGIPTTATIVWAGFYSQGFLGRTLTNTRDRIQNNPSFLIRPNGTSITVQPNTIDLYPYQSDEYTYSTFTEIPELIGLSGNEANGNYTGASIIAREGDDDSALGYFAAWSLVIVYTDDSETLKNISVFDGYKQIGGSNDSITVDGFLTPSTGKIKSTLSVFVGEGDKNIDGDTISVNNIELPSSEDGGAFNSTINGFTAIPNPINFQGIDIHNYEIGIDGDNSHEQIIGTNETSAKIDLVTTGDYYYPSVVAFTTELYEPRVCYSQELYDSDGNKLTEAIIGDHVTVRTWISNMKKKDPDTNLPEPGDLEPADKVEISMELDSENLKYISSSTTIQNIGETTEHNKTDNINDDTAEYFSDHNKSIWRVGTGANGSDGGKLLPNLDNSDNKKVFIKFQTELIQSGDLNVTNKYFVSYENSLLGIRFGDESPFNIELCENIDTGITVGAPLGVFNVVNQNFSGATISEDASDPNNALYTQVAGNNFIVNLIALNSNFTTLNPYTGDVSLSIIETPAFTNQPSDQILCDNSIASSTQLITFTDESSKSLTLNYPIARKKVSFKISYVDGGITKHVCSRDNFSIKPAKYTMTPDTTPLIGGKNHTLTLKATTTAENVLNGYNQTIDGTPKLKATMDLIIPPGCTLPPENINLTVPFSFANGTTNYTPFIYPNIGDIKITISDNDWTSIDQNTNIDCIVDSKENIHDGYGKVGCKIETEKDFSFTPKEFKNTLSIQNFNSASFTYIAGNDINMNADLNLQATAVLDDGNTAATNYTEGCYAQNIDSTITLLNDPTEWLTNDSTAIARIVYLDDNSITTTFDSNPTIGSGKLSSTQNMFASGIANVIAKFNFSRSATSPDEPFNIDRDDFNLTIQDVNGLTGNGFDATANTTTKFYYGRSHAPDQRFAINPGVANIFYEVYCSTCNRAAMGMNAYLESSDSINWYINSDHTVPIQGQFNDTPLTYSDGTNDTATNLNSATLQAPTVPHKDKVQLNSDAWLIYDPTDFLVEFYKDNSDWAGEGQLGVTVDTNVSIRQNRRIDW